MEGIILYVCISERKGTVKHAVPCATLVENFGFEGDAHAGSRHRHVSLLGDADIETMRVKGLELNPGAFGENLVVSGIDLSALGIGTRLKIGVAELELTQIGKICHNHCAIYHKTGDCIMPRAGLFARVIKGGDVVPQMKVKLL